jgi:multidrug efflux pump subunit AcrB
MTWLIELALNNTRAVTVAMLALVLIGLLALTLIPTDILPVYNRPGVQVLTFYTGMPAESIANAITNRMERWAGQASGIRRQESRSILGASIVRNYFHSDVDPSGALTQVNSLALAEIPNLPPGTLPPIVLPYDPTDTVPSCIVAVDSKSQGESTLYDVARYEVRNYIMSSPGANAPVVFGGKVRCVLAYLDPIKLQARGLSPVDVMNALDRYNVFLPTGDAKFGELDCAVDSNAMYKVVEHMKDIPLRVRPDKTDFLGDVADPKDASFIQTNVVRINGKREVYIPVFRQHGASTLAVVDRLREALPEWSPRLTAPDINLRLVMDQSIYVRQSIKSLAIEGILGAVLCSLTILLFLGQWRMTFMAVLTIPITVLTALALLYLSRESINVMTLAGLALSVGPMVDSAIICLENTERHLSEGASVRNAALLGASEVAMPELTASACTLLVLAPLALMPSSGQFLFKPMALAVAYAMTVAYILSRSFIPSRCATWLKPHAHAKKEQGGEQPQGEPWEREQARREHIQREPSRHRRAPGSPGRDEPDRGEHGEERTEESPKGLIRRAYARWEGWVDAGIAWYGRRLDWTMEHRWLMVLAPLVLMILMVVVVGPFMRREFFPAVDAGAFEIYVRAPTGTRIERTEDRIAEVENVLKQTIGDDLELAISELGVWPDWSAAYTPNSGPMDTIMRIQLKEERKNSAQHWAQALRTKFAQNKQFSDLEFAFNTGGTISSALNEGRPTPLNLRIEGKHPRQSRKLAEQILAEVKKIDGVVDSRILQRLDYPEYLIEVDRAKARELALTQEDIMKCVISSLNSSIQFNKKNFWIDPKSQNQYWVGVQYPESDIKSVDTLKNISITSPLQQQAIPLSNLVTIKATNIAAEVTHDNLQTAIDLEMNVHGRDLGHVADDLERSLNQFGWPEPKSFWSLFSPSGEQNQGASWLPFDPDDPSRQKTMEATRMKLSGEYGHMTNTFTHFGIGLTLAVVFVYFIMVTLLDSYIVPLLIMYAVPLGLLGIIPMLYLTSTAINVQSLLGVIFVVGILVSHKVLLTDFAEEKQRAEKLSPTEAIIAAAKARVRPVMMTLLAAILALIPMSLALEKGSEANAPLGRAVIGGLLSSILSTLFVTPALYSLAVREDESVQEEHNSDEERDRDEQENHNGE